MVTLDQAGRGSAWTRLLAPTPHLSGIIEHAWVQRVPNGASGPWRIVADSSPHVIAHGGRDGSVRVRVVGARRHWTDGWLDHRAWTAGVRLHPGVLPLLTGAPAGALTDRGEDAWTLFGSAGTELMERVAGARTPEAVTTLLMTFVADRCRTTPDGPRSAGLARALARAGSRAARVRDLAARTGLAERTLRQVCSDEVGLSPVRISRIGRLHRALALRIHEPHVGWSRIALRAGYADQPHMIREFGSLLGEPPGRFAMRADAGPADSFNTGLPE